MWGITVITFAQEKKSIALISIDTKGIEITGEAMANLVRLELEKIDRFEVLDKYDVADLIVDHNLDPKTAFGKTKVIEAGGLLNSDKMLTGSAEKFGDKIIIILRLIDVKAARIEKTSVMEFLDVQKEVQTMVKITLNELLDIPNDPHLVDLLIDYNVPITNMKTNVNLSGPRMGAVYFMGENGDRLRDSKDIGGYDMFPVATMFGYQFETQYLSAGNFQALIEVVATLNGLETGKLIPSIAFLNGFRFNESGWEFGLGPVVRVSKTAEGYYDDNGNWNLINGDDSPGYPVVERIDSRGTMKPSLSMVIALGKTYKSGYLNVPFNVYYSPRKNGGIVGVTFGFNTMAKPQLNK